MTRQGCKNAVAGNVRLYRAISALLACFVYICPVHAQPGSIVIDNFLGLNNTDTAATILPFEGQDMLNVESNLGGTSIKKRGGYAREASLTVATSPVNGSFQFTCDNGDEVVIVCHDTHCAKSVNGTAFANFLSSGSGSNGTNPTRWSFVSVDGDLYGGNDQQDPIFKYDCSTLSYPGEIPAGSLLSLSEDRLIVGDTSANPNRIHYSKSADFEEFTAGTESVDSYTDDMGAPGERTTAMIYDRGKLWLFKRTSITACILGDQYTSECFPISNNIGTQDPLSVVSAPDGIYFRGQDRAYWRVTGAGLDPLSLKIKGFIISQAVGATRSNTQTTEADWASGNLTLSGPGAPTSSSRIFGSITVSTWTDVDTSSANFSGGSGSIDISSIAGSVILSSTVIEDDFSDLDFTSNPVWTPRVGDSWDANFLGREGKLAFTGGSSISHWINTPSSISSGSISIDFSLNACTVQAYCFIFKFLKEADGDFYGVALRPSSGSTRDISLIKVDATAESTTTLSQTTITAADQTEHSLEITISSSGVMSVSNDGVFIASATDTDFTTPSVIEVYNENFGSAFGLFYVDNLFMYRYNPSTFTSRIFDTTFSTPTPGPFVVDMSSDSSSTITYTLQASTANDGGGFETEVVQTPGEIDASANRRYKRYLAFFNPVGNPWETAELKSVTLNAATTAQYLSQCIQPGSNISAWGTISCASTVLGNSSLTIAVSTGTSCSDLTTSGNVFTDQANNATISVAVAAAMNFRLDFSMPGSSTDTIQVDACTVNWAEGSVAQPISGVYESINNSIYWTGQTTAATSSDRILKYDMNLRQFYPFSLSAVNLLVVNNAVKFGSSDGGFWNHLAPKGIFSDNGSDIEAFWISKDFGGLTPFQDTEWKTASIIATNSGTGSLTITHSYSSGLSGSHVVSIATDSTKNYIRDTYYLPKVSPENFLNIKIGNNSQAPFEIMGLRIDFHTVPWKPLTP